MSRRSPASPGRAMSALLIIGCLGVLGATFMAGLLTGRYWPRPASPPAPASAVARPGPSGSRGDRTVEPPPLTFYRELTAPLPPGPARSPALGPARPRPEPDAEGARKATANGAAAPAARRPPSQGSFTVQVGAFRAREPAEALRAALVAAGYDAYVTEGPGHFRVRVGTFGSREEARQAARRLAGERPLGAYVTTR